MSEPNFTRGLPHSAEAERAIVGGVILDNGLITQAIEWTKPPDYYIPSHRRVFVAQVGLFERGLPIDPITIAEELKKDNALETLGGISFITNLTYGLPHSLNIEHYAKVIRGKSLLRRLITTAASITSEALEEEDEPEIILDHAERQIFSISDERIRGGFAHVRGIAEEVLDKIESQGSQTTVTGLATGFHEIDVKTSGLQRSDLIIVAARPSVGKTAYALMLALNAAKEGAVVGIHSLEMSKEALVIRLICANANIDQMRFRNGFLSKAEWGKVATSLGELAELKIFIDDTPGVTATEIRAKGMRLKTEQKRLDLEIVDYLQLMTGSGKRWESRQQEVALISRELKGVAKELGVPLVALSQLSRAPEARADRRPMLSDLRDSGALEQDADMVKFLYRPELHMSPQQAEEHGKQNVAEIIIAKQRNGPTGTVELRFTPTSMRFDSLYRE